MIYVRPRSTRHTRIGTLRAGVIYALDDANAHVHEVLFERIGRAKPTLRAAYERMSKAQAEKAQATVESLEPKAPPATPETAALKARITALEAEIGDLEAGVARRDALLAEHKIALPPADGETGEG